MRETKKTEIIISLLLTAVFLFPSIVQITHLSKNHEHVVCFDHSDHLHGITYDCSIQDFQITPFDFNPLSELKTSEKIILSSTESHYYYISNKPSYYTTNSLRAPPYTS